MSTVHQKTGVVALEEVMGRIVEQVVAAGPQIKGKKGGEISALVKQGALDADDAIRHVTDGQDLLDAYSKAEAVAVLAVWQLLSMGAYINAQENELQAASAATKH